MSFGKRQYLDAFLFTIVLIIRPLRYIPIFFYTHCSSRKIDNSYSFNLIQNYKMFNYT